jgi:type II secretory pathway pseudopilin PulG
VILAALIPIYYIIDTRARVAQAATQANNAMDSMLSAVDFAASQGPGSKIVVTAYLPPGYESSESSLNNTLICLKFYLADGTPYNLCRHAKAKLNGSLPKMFGYASISFVLNESGYVFVS